jgi:hypothetical protein
VVGEPPLSERLQKIQRSPWICQKDRQETRTHRPDSETKTMHLSAVGTVCGGEAVILDALLRIVLPRQFCILFAAVS